MKVGKIVAISVGGSIILLQVAANEGYISIDWNKITKKANKIADKAEEAITGEGPSWAEKVRNILLRFFTFALFCALKFDLKRKINILDQNNCERKLVYGNFICWWILNRHRIHLNTLLSQLKYFQI